MNTSPAKLSQPSGARGVAVLMGGTGGSQILMVAATPILTRIYSPEAFGLLAVFTSFLLVFGVVASLRYSLALPLPRHAAQARRLLVLCIALVCANSLVALALVWTLGPLLQSSLGVPALASTLWLLPVGILALGLHDVSRQWALRCHRFDAIAQARLLKSSSTVAVQIGAQFLGSLGLLVGVVVGHGAASLRTGTVAWNALRMPGNLRWRRILQTARTYRGFPLLSTWTGLSSTGAAQLPPLAIAAALGVGPAGLFGITHRLLAAPMALIGKAAGDVFYARASNAYRTGTLAPLMLATYSKLFSVGLPAALIGVLAAPDVIGPLLGEEWREVGYLAQIMTPWMFMQFITTAPTRVFPVINRHGTALRFQASLLIASLMAVLLGSVWLADLRMTVTLLAIFNSVIYGSRLFTAFQMSGVSPAVILRASARPFCLGLLAALPFGTAKILNALSDIPSIVSYGSLATSLTAFLVIVFAVLRQSMTRSN